jgi:AcrR family transcriptional regulator
MTVVQDVSLREHKKRQTRARIIESAIRLIGERGFDGLTVEEIAAAAEVGKGTIYNYFLTKEEIVVAFMADVERRAQERLRRFSSASRPVEPILTDFILYQFRLKEPYRKFIPILIARMFARGEEMRPYVESIQDSVDAPIRELFRQLGERRLIRRDIEFADLIMIFKMHLFGLTIAWLNDRPPYRATARLVRQAARIFAQGVLRARKAERRKAVPRKESIR